MIGRLIVIAGGLFCYLLAWLHGRQSDWGYMVFQCLVGSLFIAAALQDWWRNLNRRDW
jgi:hypothetical protein